MEKEEDREQHGEKRYDIERWTERKSEGERKGEWDL